MTHRYLISQDSPGNSLQLSAGLSPRLTSGGVAVK